MNKVILVGRLTKEPELKYTPGNGVAVTTITVAVDGTLKDENGKVKAEFIPVVIWGKQAENTAQYMTKGSLVAISGRISIRSYEAKDGSKRYVTEVIADNFNGINFLSTAATKSSKKNEEISEVSGDYSFVVDDEDSPF